MAQQLKVIIIVVMEQGMVFTKYLRLLVMDLSMLLWITSSWQVMVKLTLLLAIP